jgi:hypothetical protein
MIRHRSSRDDDAGALVKLAQQMQEQRPARGRRAFEISERVVAAQSYDQTYSEGEGGQGRYGSPVPIISRSRSEASLDRVSPWR